MDGLVVRVPHHVDALFPELAEHHGHLGQDLASPGSHLGAARGEKHLVHEVDFQFFPIPPDPDLPGVHFAVEIGHQGIVGLLQLTGLFLQFLGAFFRLVLLGLGLEQLMGQALQGLGYALAVIQAVCQIGGQSHGNKDQQHHQKFQ